MRTFSHEGTLRICPQQIYPIQIVKKTSLNKKEMVKEGILEYQEERTPQRVKMWIYTT